jgi:hypothetical protein
MEVFGGILLAECNRESDLGFSGSEKDWQGKARQ